METGEFDDREREVVRRSFFYYRERHDHWAIGVSDLTPDDAVRGTILSKHGGTAPIDPYVYEEDQYSVPLAMARILDRFSSFVTVEGE